MLIIAVAFCALNTAFLVGGVRLGMDSSTYINDANALVGGELFGGRPGGWLAYKSLIALCKVLGVGLTGVVFLQLCVAAVAAAALFDIVRKLSDRNAGLVAAALVIVNPELARWHHYILTDSLYTSMLVITMWFIQRAKALRRSAFAIALAFIVLTALVRPHGWLLLPIATVYWFGGLVSRPIVRAGAILIVAGLCLWAALQHPSVGANLPYHFTREGDLIHLSKDWTMPLPPHPGGPDVNYFVQHPFATSGLMLARIGVEAVFVRPHYSWGHNLAAIAGLLIVYPLAVLGFIRIRHNRFAWMLIIFMALHMAPIAIRGADWDNRYGDFILPLILVFAGCGTPERLRRWIAAFPSARRSPARTELASV